MINLFSSFERYKLAHFAITWIAIFQPSSISIFKFAFVEFDNHSFSFSW